jgi:hypothetical protein
MVTIQHSNVELEDTSIDRVEALYETIDETKMLDTPIQLMNPDEGGMPSFISDSPINGGYISPYHKVIDEEVSLSVSSSLSGSPLGEDYINPYQPMIQNESVHEYSSTHNKLPNYSESSKEKVGGNIHVYNLLEKNIDVHEYNSIHYLQDHSSGSDGSQVGSGNQIPYEPQTENKEPVILEINDCDRNSARCDPMQNNSVSYDPMKSNSVSCNPMQNNSMSCHPM